MTFQPSAEEWIKKFDAAIAKGRGGVDAGPDRDTAIAELKALGLTPGDAEYFLDKRR